MDATELADELAQPGSRDLLASAELLRLAYDGRDGSPRVIPIGFFWDGSAIVVCTIPNSPKVGAMRKRPRVAVTIDTGASPADSKSLLVRGTAEIEIVEGVPDEYLAAAEKTMDAEMHAGFETQVRQLYERMARIRIVPTWARFYDFGAARLPRTLQSMIDEAST